MLVNYFHDLSVALLASNVIVVYLLGRYVESHPERVDILANVFHKLSKVTYWTLGYVLVGGAFRSYFFMEFEWNPAVGKGQIAALVVKHIILFAVAAFGIITHVRYVKKYGSHQA